MRPEAYPRVEHLQGVSLGQAPALPTIIRLGCKGLPETNTLAYYDRKSFITLGPGVGVGGGQDGRDVLVPGSGIGRCFAVTRHPLQIVFVKREWVVLALNKM